MRSEIGTRTRRDLLLASALLAWLGLIALNWPIPFMAWDHLDLVPMLQAFQREGLTGVDLLALHGGHYHSAAYLWLLASTLLSGGWPQADVLSSLVLLAAHAALLWRILERSGVLAVAGAWRWLLWLLVLYPGHLANLQWGWQVAVFLCLAGVSLVIERLTAEPLRHRDNLLALGAALIACTSFASGLAVLPVAMLLLATRNDLSVRTRLLMLLPWLLLVALLAGHYFGQRPVGAISPPTALAWTHYTLNFIAGGLFRSVTDLAAPLAALALLQLAILLWRSPAVRSARPLLALVLFSGGVAALTATGRAADYGADQAFVTRYVSFSVLFWIGWCALMLLARRERGRLPWLPRAALLLAALFAVFNALHLSRKAVQLGQRMDALASALESGWPQADEARLAELYFDDPEEARRRLDQLCRWGFAPFEAGHDCANAGAPAPP